MTSEAQKGNGSVAIGIDLGTTHSVVAAYKAGRVEIFADANGSRATPSIVGFLDGEAFVGDAAKDLPVTQQVFDAKRLIGRPWSDALVQKDRASWPFELLEVKGAPRVRLDIGGRKENFAPEQISAMVLGHLRETAARMLEQPVCKAVVTVPAYFNECQRQATKDACKIAGLEVLCIINEPTAAAIAYGMDNQATGKRTVFIYDLGGGTFDVSIVEIEGGMFKVLASGGDTHLGGQDFDVRLMEHCLKDIKKKHGLDLRALKDAESLFELRKACEMAKRRLSMSAEVRLMAAFSRHNVVYSTNISRATFEGLCADLFHKTIEISEELLAEAKLTRKTVDEVVLVGGSTRIPKVKTLLRDLFLGKELKHSIHPDEAVAYGAAVRAASLADSAALDQHVELQDVTPLSLGIARFTRIDGTRADDAFHVVVAKNTPIPCRKTELFVNAEDFRSSIGIQVYQGEQPIAKDNHFLKRFSIKVPPKPKHEVEIDVTFEIDAEGLLTVTAVEKSTGQQSGVTITAAEAHLSEKQITDMRQRAKRFQRADGEAFKCL